MSGISKRSTSSREVKFTAGTFEMDNHKNRNCTDVSIKKNGIDSFIFLRKFNKFNKTFTETC